VVVVVVAVEVLVVLLVVVLLLVLVLIVVVVIVAVVATSWMLEGRRGKVVRLFFWSRSRLSLEREAREATT